MDARFDTMEARSDARFDAIEGSNRRLERKLSILAQRDDARTFNSTGTTGDPTLMALPSDDGELPPGFPKTYEAFKSLNGEQIDALLNAYGRPYHEPVEPRRLRLACVIGHNYR
ncbi:hypothetical protein FRC10_007866 [Ceratobasidium sp. 414]|nr:hypothetical protein FRC10_007866 [Ceratobasidium sp. 414]